MPDDRVKNIMRQDAAALGMPIPDEEWGAIAPQLRVARFRKRETIFQPGVVGAQVILITDGIAATKAVLESGQEPIGRFFVRLQGCANLISAWRQEATMETVFAATDVTGVLMTWDFFQQQFFDGGAFGRYARYKLLDALVINNETLKLKTSGNIEVNYQFLEERFPLVIKDVTQKLIASYLGLTPEGFSRFLKRRREATS